MIVPKVVAVIATLGAPPRAVPPRVVAGGWPPNAVPVVVDIVESFDEMHEQFFRFYYSESDEKTQNRGAQEITANFLRMGCPIFLS